MINRGKLQLTQNFKISNHFSLWEDESNSETIEDTNKLNENALKAIARKLTKRKAGKNSNTNHILFM